MEYPVFERNLFGCTTPYEITDQFRRLCLEGLTDFAARRLKEFVPGISDAQVQDVLQARSRFINPEGSEGIAELLLDVEEASVRESFLSDLAYIYRGLYRHHDGKLYRPYGYVGSYGLIDAVCQDRQMQIVYDVLGDDGEYDVEVHRRLLFADILQAAIRYPDPGKRMKADPLYRAWHYAANHDDLALMVEGEAPGNKLTGRAFAALLAPFEDEPPTFYDCVKKDPSEAWLDMIKHPLAVYDLKEYGFHVSYPEFGTNPILARRFIKEALGHSGGGQFIQRLDAADDAFAEERKKAVYSQLRERILAQSQIEKYGMASLKDEQGRTLAEVPRLPLVAWVLSQAGRQDEIPDSYISVSPVGMKMANDCPYHTDWMIGAGLSLEEDYGVNCRLQEAAYRWSSTYQRESLDFSYNVLAAGRKVTGTIRHCFNNAPSEVEAGDIIIIPDSSPKYQLHVEKAIEDDMGGVIALNGSKVAHLATVGRERGVTIFQVDNAFEKYPNGSIVTLDPDAGVIEIISAKPSVPAPA